MTAKEMFKKLGFMQQIKEYDFGQFDIVYYSMYGYQHNVCITFDSKDKAVYTGTSFLLFPKIDVPKYKEIIKAIHKQLVELGWLDD